MSETKGTMGPFELDSAKDRDGRYRRYQIIHGKLPVGVKSDFGYPIADTMNRHHCISPEEDEANGHILAAAWELLEACEKVHQHIMGLHAYLRTCDTTVIADNVDSLAAALGPEKQRLADAIAKAKGF